MKLNWAFKDLCHFMNVSLLAVFFFFISSLNRLLNILKKSTFIFASVIFLMSRYPRITYVFKFLVGFGLLSYMSTISVKIITSAMSTQLYGSLLNDCAFLVIHKVKYYISDFVWLHHLAILRYTRPKWKQHSFFSYITLLHCRPIGHEKCLPMW